MSEPKNTISSETLEKKTVPAAEISSEERSRDAEDVDTSLDPLKRQSKFSWKSFGGEGFIFSIIFHAVILIIALFLVVRHIVNTPPEDPDAFVTGAGGGNNGNQAKIQEHRMKPRNARDMVKSKTRIASKSANSTIALPEMPQMQMNSSFDTGMSAGGDSSGFGGGSGGGVGTGKGIGVGSGRNFVSAFGKSGLDLVGGLKGIYYDLKVKADDSPSAMSAGTDDAQERYVKLGRSFVRGGWKAEKFDGYFKSSEMLTTYQVFIPSAGPSSADRAPAAFGHPEKKGSRWYVHYTAVVSPNKTGRIRLLGIGDDILCARFGKKIMADGGFDLMSTDSRLHGGFGEQKVLGETASWKRINSFSNMPFRRGPWISVKSGSRYPIDVLIGETPGGNFYAALLFEVEGKKKGEPEGKPILMRFGDEELPEEIAKGAWTNEIDMTGGGWIFKATNRRGLSGF